MDQTTTTHRPLIRHESLRPLSRDHYQGLVQAQRLISAGSGMAADPYDLIENFLHIWETEIAAHFADEERLLGSLIESPADRLRLYHEHTAIRSMVLSVKADLARGAVDAELVKGLGQVLHDHIRWEERVLFESIQDSVSPEQLHILTKETITIEHARRRCSCGS
jgi:hypothetical protein